MDFNMIDWYSLLIQAATILVSFFGGGAALVPIINWLKKVLKLDGNMALGLTLVFSLIMGLAVMLVEGQITPDSFTVANFSVLFLAIYAASQKFYDKLKTS